MRGEPKRDELEALKDARQIIRGAATRVCSEAGLLAYRFLCDALHHLDTRADELNKPIFDPLGGRDE